MRCFDQYLDVKVLHEGESWDPFDLVMMYMGMEWNGTLQFPGGMQRKDLDNITRMAEYAGKIGMLEVGEVPDIGTLLAKRKDLAQFGDVETIRNSLDAMAAVIRNREGATFGDTYDLNVDDKVVVLGDSHAMSAYTQGATVLRNDFKTLHGALQQRLVSFFDERAGLPRHLTLYFGSIDLRHHICRLGKTEAERQNLIFDMVENYYTQAVQLSNEFSCSFSVAAPMHIESEDRQIPKTGYYEGKPFHGSHFERTMARQFFVHRLKMRFSEERVFDWPADQMDSNQVLDQKYMEKPRSVHMSPEHYPYNIFDDRVSDAWKDNADYCKLHG